MEAWKTETSTILEECRNMLKTHFKGFRGFEMGSESQDFLGAIRQPCSWIPVIVLLGFISIRTELPDDEVKSWLFLRVLLNKG